MSDLASDLIDLYQKIDKDINLLKEKLKEFQEERPNTFDAVVASIRGCGRTTHTMSIRDKLEFAKLLTTITKENNA